MKCFNAAKKEGWISPNMLREQSQRIAVKFKCAYCKKIFSKTFRSKTDPKLQSILINKTKMFCSDECRRKWWKENHEQGQRKETAIYKLVCAFCRTEFESYGNKHRKYCCHECYIKDRFRNNTTSE